VKCHHPEVFLAAILNAQPLGFYAPAQLIADARAHDVLVLPIDINHSRWDCTLENQPDGSFAVRLGLRMIKGLHEDSAALLVAARHGPYQSLEEVWRRTEMPLRCLELLADADTCSSVGIDRRQALWCVRGLSKPLPLFSAAAAAERSEPSAALAPLSAGENVVQDYTSLSFTLRAHPVSFLRAELRRARWGTLGDLRAKKDGDFARIAGLVLVRQRPGSANGIVFITLEDETGVANLVVWPSFFEANRAVVMTSRLLACEGRVQREGEIIHIVAQKLVDLTGWMHRIGDADLERAEKTDAQAHPRLRVKSRDFH